MGNNPSHFKGDDLPVDSISLYDAKEFCRKLSQTTGQEYRLPTQDEWVYACRAGTGGAYAGDLDAMAWYDSNSGSKPHPVGQQRPNAFGLYDMHGNVWEWCDGGGVRGGSWHSNSTLCRSGFSTFLAANDRDYDLGFRVVVPVERSLEVARASLKSAIASANSLAPSLRNSIGMELILIKPGEFRMGDDGGNQDEKPAHVVVIKNPFYMGKYEVTQAQWHEVMGNKPEFKGNNLPVGSVSFNGAKEFCKKLSQMTGQEYRLPTEAEWEYACRAGTTGAYAGDLDAMAWYNNDSRFGGHWPNPVGQKQPNAFGLFDMHGNVWEWCEDLWHGNYNGSPNDSSAWLSGGDICCRVLRGGSSGAYGRLCRSAYRLRSDSGNSYGDFGFRVVLSARTQ